MSCYKCTRCGACSLGQTVEVIAGECPVCHAKNNPGDLKCSQCGMSLPVAAGERNSNKNEMGSNEVERLTKGA